MTRPVDSEMQILNVSHSECVALLGTQHFGRLAVQGADGPLIFPVNYATQEGLVVIATDEGTKLDVTPMTHVAFEADNIDSNTHEGWSVVVRGTAWDISDALDPRSVQMRELPITTWAPGPKEHRLLVRPQLITGRRLQLRRRAGRTRRKWDVAPRYD